MVTLQQALEALFKDVLIIPTRLAFTISHLKGYWRKQLEELSAEELAYTLTIMVHVGVNMTEEEREKWRLDFFRENPIIALLREGREPNAEPEPHPDSGNNKVI